MRSRILIAGLAVLAFLMPALAENYMFAPAPQQDLNRIFRVDRATGEVIACQFAINDETSVGLTLCHPPGEGAKAREAGDYGLIASSHRQEAGIFRVNKRTGEVSICYVRGEQETVCTPPVK